MKGYRHKKRISFIAKNYRVDLTIVRDYNNANPKSFVSNKTFSVNDILKEENYEIEIEVIKNDKITALEFSRIGVKIYEIINEEDKEDRPDIKEEEAETTMSWMLPNRIGYGEKIFKNFPPENYQQKKVMECDCKDGVCDIADKSISLYPQQRLIKDYIQIDSPFRGAFLYHGLGSGKSGASIAAAEGYINKKNMFILSPASLAVNYENEILKISSIVLNLKKDWFLVKVSKTNQNAMKILLEKYAIDK